MLEQHAQLSRELQSARRTFLEMHLSYLLQNHFVGLDLFEVEDGLACGRWVEPLLIWGISVFRHWSSLSCLGNLFCNVPPFQHCFPHAAALLSIFPLCKHGLGLLLGKVRVVSCSRPITWPSGQAISRCTASLPPHMGAYPVQVHQHDRQ